MKKRISLLICCSLLAATTAFTTALPSSAAEVTDEISQTANVLQTSGETKNYNGFEYRIITSKLNEVYSEFYKNWSAEVGDVEIIGYTGTGDTVTIPNTIDGKKVTVVVSRWFPDCGAKSITVPNGIKIIIGSFINEDGSVSAYATTLNSKLTEINIPGSVTNIYSTSFNSSNLTSINVDSSNKNYSSSDGILYNKEKTFIMAVPHGKTGSCSIPESVTSITSSTFNGCNSLTNINVDSKNKYYCSVDGVVFNKNKTKIVAFPRGRKGSYSIPSGVTSVDSYSFSDCSNLTSVFIPNSVTSVDMNAFSYCNGLTSVSIPNSVTYIGGDAFYSCKNLASIYIPESVTKIGGLNYDPNSGADYTQVKVSKTPFSGLKNLTIYGIPGSTAEQHANENNFSFKDFNTLSLEEQITLFASPANTASSAALTVISSDDSAAHTYTAAYDKNTKKFIFDYTPKAKDKIVFTAVSKLTGETVKTFEHTFTQSEIVKGANALAVSVSGDINKNVDLSVETVAVGNNDNDTPIIPGTKNTKYGDLDGDGIVTSADALLVLRASVNLEKFDAEKTKLADVDGDGAITSSDSLFILRNSVGLKDNGTLFN